MIPGPNSMILWGEVQIILFWRSFISDPMTPPASLESRYFVMGQSSIIVDQFYKLCAIGYRRGLVQTCILSVAKTVWFHVKTVWFRRENSMIWKHKLLIILFWRWFILGSMTLPASLESYYSVKDHGSIIVDQFYKLCAIGYRHGLVQTCILSVAKTVWFHNRNSMI